MFEDFFPNHINWSGSDHAVPLTSECDFRFHYLSLNLTTCSLCGFTENLIAVSFWLTVAYYMFSIDFFVKI